MQFPITCKSGQPSILSQVKGYFPNGSIKYRICLEIAETESTPFLYRL